MGTPTSTPAALASAKQALKNAELFGHRDTGNKKAGDKPSYSAARSARATESTAGSAPSTDSREFMGVRANQSNEINTALASRDEARKALNQ